jgi:hypothetical protein
MLGFIHDDNALRGFGSEFKWLTEATMKAELIKGPVLTELQRETPVAKKPIKGHEPGFLRDSIRGEVVSGAGMVGVRYSTDVDYAGIVVDGSAPHEIVARNTRYLHWVDENTGEDVFRYRVWHPGTQPNDFPGRTADRVMPLVESAFGTVFERF